MAARQGHDISRLRAAALELSDLFGHPNGRYCLHYPVPTLPLDVVGELVTMHTKLASVEPWIAPKLQEIITPWLPRVVALEATYTLVDREEWDKLGYLYW